MTLKWKFGQVQDTLEKEVDKIVGNATVEELLEQVDPEIPYDDIQTARLSIRKLSNLVWQVSYVIFLDPKTRHFEEVSIKSVTEPSLRLALFEINKQVNKE